jgi:hypothetical protein
MLTQGSVQHSRYGNIFKRICDNWLPEDQRGRIKRSATAVCGLSFEKKRCVWSMPFGPGSQHPTSCMRIVFHVFDLTRGSWPGYCSGTCRPRQHLQVNFCAHPAVKRILVEARWRHVGRRSAGQRGGPGWNRHRASFRHRDGNLLQP